MTEPRFSEAGNGERTDTSSATTGADTEVRNHEGWLGFGYGCALAGRGCVFLASRFSRAIIRCWGRIRAGARGDGLGPGGWHCGTAQVMHLPLPAPNVVGLGALDSLQSRREAGLCGASLSADVPLMGRVAHAFLSCQGVTICDLVQIVVVGFTLGAG